MGVRILILLIIGLTELVFGQSPQKHFKNGFAYAADSTVYSYKRITSTDRAIRCKTLLKNEEQQDLLFALIESKEVIKVEGLFNWEGRNKQAQANKVLYTASPNEILGPFESDYGSFRYIVVQMNPVDRERKSYYTVKLEGKNKKKVQQLAQDILCYWKYGVGNIKRLERRVKRHKYSKPNDDSFRDAKQNREIIAKAPTGKLLCIMEHDNLLVVLRMFKVKTNDKAVWYKEYIFK